MKWLWLALSASCTANYALPDTDTGAPERTVGLPGGVVSAALALTDECPDDPDKDAPGLCGCGWTDVDVDDDSFADACVHDAAHVDATAVLGSGVYVHDRAVVGAGAELSAGVVIGVAARVGADATVGLGSFIGRRAAVGSNSHVGPDSVLGRSATIGDDVDAAVGSLSMGYAASLGDRVQVLGPNVVLGNLVSVGDDSILYGDVVVARNTTIGSGSTIGQGSILGPEVTLGERVELGAGSRIRKQVHIGSDTELGTQVRIGRDTEVGSFVTIGNQAVLRADVYVGDNVSIDPNAYLPRGTRLEAIDPENDEPPVVVITSPANGANLSGETLTLTGTVTDDYGVAQLDLSFNDGTPQTISFSGGSFSATVTVPAETHSIRVTATDGAGQVGSDLLYVDDCRPGPDYDYVWNGSVSQDWTDGNNWTSASGGVPTESDSAFICGAIVNQPRLLGATSVGDLALSQSAELTLRNYSLTATGDVHGGTISGGTVYLTGDGTVRGTLPTVYVRGQVALAGPLTAVNALYIDGGYGLDVGQSELTVNGPFRQTLTNSTDGLHLLDRGQVQFNNDATFNGSVDMAVDRLAAGSMRFAASITANQNTYAVFQPRGTRVSFVGTSSQYINISTGSATTSRFDDVYFENSGIVFVASGSELFVDGDMRVRDGARVHIANSTGNEVHGRLILTGTGRVSSATSGAALHTYGPLQLNDDAQFQVYQAYLHGPVTESEGSSFGATHAYFYNQLPAPTGTWAVTNGYITTPLALSADYNARPATTLYVNGEGALDTRGFEFTLQGAYHQSLTQPGAGLAVGEGSVVRFQQLATFNGSVPMPSTAMASGEVHFERDLTVGCSSTIPCFLPAGSDIVFDGVTSQTVTMSGSSAERSHFESLRIENTTSYVRWVSGSPLYATGSVTVADGASLNVYNPSNTVEGTLRLQGSGRMYGGTNNVLYADGPVAVDDSGHLDVDVVHLASGISVASGAQVSGNDIYVYGELPRPEGTWSVARTRVVDAVELDADYAADLGGTLLVNGDGAIDTQGFDFTVNSAYQQTLSNAEAGLTVTGDSVVRFAQLATFGGSVPMPATAMATGEVHFERDLTVNCSSTTPCFVPAGSGIIFDGITSQDVTISGSSAERSHFASLRVENTASYVRWVSGSPLYATGSVTVADGANLYLYNPSNTVEGNLRLQGSGRVYGGTNNVLNANGPVAVDDTGHLDVDVVHVQSGISVASGAQVSGNDVYMYGELPQPLGTWSVVRTRVMDAVALDADYSANLGGTLVVTGDGAIDTQGFDFTVNSAYQQTLSNATAGLTVTGDSVVRFAQLASFGGSVPMPATAMASGEVHFERDLTVNCSSTTPCFVPAGSDIVFDGSTSQDVTISGSSAERSHFDDLRVENTASFVRWVSGSPLYATGDVTVANGANLYLYNPSNTVDGTLRMQGSGRMYGGTNNVLYANGPVAVDDSGHLDVDVVHLASGISVASGAQVSGNDIYAYGELPRPLGTWSVTRTRVTDAIALDADYAANLGGTLVVTGDGAIDTQGFDFTVNSTYQQTLSDANAGLTVTGDSVVRFAQLATFGGSVPMPSTAMSTGEVHFERDLTVSCSSTIPCFLPAGSDIVFDGTTGQDITISGSSAERSHFGDVRIENPVSYVRWQSGSPLYATGTVTVADQALLYILNATNTVEGDVVVNGAGRVYGTTGDALTVLGDARVLGTGAELEIPTLYLYGGVEVAVGATLDSDNVYPYTEWPRPDGDWQVTNTRITTPLSLSADFAGALGTTVYFTGAGALSTNGWDFTLNSAFNQSLSQAGAGLQIDGESQVGLRGATTFSGSVAMDPGALDTGSLAFGHDLTVSCSSTIACFVPTGTDIVFDGTVLQDVTFSNSSTADRSHFADFRVTNTASLVRFQSGTPLYATGDIYVEDGARLYLNHGTNTIDGTLNLSGTGRVDVTASSGSLDIGSGLVLADTSVYDAPYTHLYGSLDAEAATQLTGVRLSMYSELPAIDGTLSTQEVRVMTPLVLAGDYDQVLPHLVLDGAGGLDLNGHNLTVRGRFTQYLNDASLGLRVGTGSTARFTGNAIFNGTVQMDAAELSGGTLAFEADLTVQNTNTGVFRPAGTTVRFDGASGTQWGYAGYSSASYLGDVVIDKASGTTILTTGSGNLPLDNLSVYSPLTLQRNTTVADTLHVGAAGSVSHNSYTLTVSGSCTGTVPPGASCP